MEVILSAEQHAQLLRIASRTGRNAEDLALEAIGHLLEYEERFVESVEKGLRTLDSGESVGHEEVGRRMERLLRP